MTERTELKPLGSTAELGVWLPIETASKRAWDFVLLAWGPEEDKSTGVGCFRGGKWIAAAVFYCMNKPKDEDFEFREAVVTPTHWMPRPEAPNA